MSSIIYPPDPGDFSLFSNFSTLAQAAVKNTAGRVFSATAENVSGPAKFFQLHNKAVPIVLGDPPTIVIPVPAAATVIMGSDLFGIPILANPLRGGLLFPVGIQWGWSTTRATYTGAPAATQATQLIYV